MKTRDKCQKFNVAMIRENFNTLNNNFALTFRRHKLELSEKSLPLARKRERERGTGPKLVHSLIIVSSRLSSPSSFLVVEIHGVSPVFGARVVTSFDAKMVLRRCLSTKTCSH